MNAIGNMAKREEFIARQESKQKDSDRVKNEKEKRTDFARCENCDYFCVDEIKNQYVCLDRNNQIIQKYQTCAHFKERDRVVINIPEKTKKTKKSTEIKKEEFSDQFTYLLMLLHTKDKGRATEEIVNEILSKEKIYTTRNDEKSEMWIYQEGIYVPNARTYIQEYCRKMLGRAYTNQINNLVISKIEADTFIDQEEFFKSNDPDLITVQNGILNTKTKKLSEFTPNIRFFNKVPVTYNPEQDCKEIKKFFGEVLQDEDEIDVIQEIFGFLLHDEYFMEKAFMFLGNGRNGKSKTLDLMKRFMGLDNCAEISLEKLEKDNFAMGELFKKKANLCGDLSSAALKNTGSFKKLTGRDLISASRKFKNMVKFQNYAKMIFSANELPVTYDITDAFFNRWIIIDFPYQFLPQREIDLIEDEEAKKKVKLRDPKRIERIVSDDEMSGLLNWALEGLDRLRKDGQFSRSPSTEQTKEKWMRKSNSCIAFLMDCVKTDYNSYVSKTEFRQLYSYYCSFYKLSLKSDKSIKNTLNTYLGVMEDRKTIDGEQKRVWLGMTWNKEEIRQGRQERHGFWDHLGEENTAISTKTVATLSKLSNSYMKENNSPQEIKVKVEEIEEKSDEKLTTYATKKPKQVVLTLINSLPKKDNNLVDVQDLVVESQKQGISESDVNSAITELKKHGDIYEPIPGLVGAVV